MALTAPLLVVLLTLAVVYFVRHPEPARRARFLKKVAFILMMVTSGFIALFVAGETMDDPGGWEGIALVASWAAPVAGLAVAGWRWPDRAAPVFVALTAAVVVLGVWYAVDSDGWRSFEDAHGPIRTIVSFAVVTAMAFFAWKRPALGGWLMLAVAVVPVGLASAGGQRGSVALIAVSSPPLFAALLFLLSAYIAGHAAFPPTLTDRETNNQRKAA
jgi:hypothetical protein